MKTTADKADAKPKVSSSVEESNRLLHELDEIAEQTVKHASESETGETPQATPPEFQLPKAAVAEEPENARKRYQFSDLLKFYFTGNFPDQVDLPTLPKRFWPALLYRFRELNKYRHDFPICIPLNSDEQWGLPFRQCIDAFLEKREESGDELENLKLAFYKLEAEIRRLADQPGKHRLSELWQAAARTVLKHTKRGKSLKEKLKQVFEEGFQSFPAEDAYLLSCYPETPRYLMRVINLNYRRNRHEAFLNRVENVISQLEDVLAADQAQQEELNAPEQLQEGMSKASLGEVDFGELSKLVSESKIYHVLPKNRYHRLQHSLNTLRSLRSLFLGIKIDNTHTASLNEKYLPEENIAASLLDAMRMYHSQKASLVAFIKALRIAELELRNRYDEKLHDRLFEEFNSSYLTDEERALQPPILVKLQVNDLSAEDKNLLLEILNSRMPIKVLLCIEDLFEKDQSAMPIIRRDEWAINIASMAINFNCAYVLQAPLSELNSVTRGMEAGFAYKGPALFSIYTPVAADATDMHGYLSAAGALESRLFPVFEFNPDNGSTWKERFSLKNNPETDKDWSVSEFKYLDQNGEEVTTSLAFTLMDWFVPDQRFYENFWDVTGKVDEQYLIPVENFLAASQADAENRLPFLYVVDDEGVLRKVLMTEKMMRELDRVSLKWKSLQELGGIHNSHALAVLEAEREKIAAEFEAKIEELKAAHETEMNQAIQELSKDLISRIAAGLLSEGQSVPVTTGLPATPPPSSAPVVPETAAVSEVAEPEPVVEEEEEEELAFDEPYIDTPLCTSCNDCINKNNMMFAYNDNKQAYIKDPSAGTFRQLVEAAEGCPVHIIHPGKPKNPDEPGLEELIKRAEKFN